MPQLVKNLKCVSFSWDDETKELTIVTTTGIPHEVLGEIKLNKVYIFALNRFITRLSQRHWLRRKK